MLLPHGTRPGSVPVWKPRRWLPGALALAVGLAGMTGLAGAQTGQPKPMPAPGVPGSVVPITPMTPPGTAAPPAAPEKTISVHFKSANWDDVLNWFSKESGLTPILTVKPTGSVDIVPPKDKKFTLSEVVDLLNEAMIQQKFILIRRQVSFYIHPTDERIDGRWPPRVELGDLSHFGKTELVQVLIPLKTLSVEDTAAEVQKMLTPFGTVSLLAKSNTLVLVDTAGNIKRIWDTLQAAEKGSGGDNIFHVHLCQWRKAEDVVEALLVKVGDRDKSFRAVAEKASNSVVIVRSALTIEEVKKLLAEIDKPVTANDPEIRKYPVPAGTSVAVAATLTKEKPTIRAVAVDDANEVWVLAAPDEHKALEAKLKDKKAPDKKE